MTPIEFPEHNVKIAEDQPEFVTLPAFYDESQGTVTYCLKLTQEERERLYATGELWMTTFTGGDPLQPIKLSCLKEDLIKP